MHNTRRFLLSAATLACVALMLAAPVVASKRTVIDGEVDMAHVPPQMQERAVTPEPRAADPPRAKRVATVIMLVVEPKTPTGKGQLLVVRVTSQPADRIGGFARAMMAR